MDLQDWKDTCHGRGADQRALHLRHRRHPGGQAGAHPSRNPGRQAAGSEAVCRLHCQGEWHGSPPLQRCFSKAPSSPSRGSWEVFQVSSNSVTLMLASSMCVVSWIPNDTVKDAVPLRLDQENCPSWNHTKNKMSLINHILALLCFIHS